LPTSSRHYRLTLADALSAHDRALIWGGLSGIRDLGAVQSAISRPYSGYHRAIWAKAAALMESVAGGNHGFTDGNKRTAIILTQLLLSKSGYRLQPRQNDPPIDALMEDLALGVARHERSFDQIASWFKARLRRL